MILLNIEIKLIHKYTSVKCILNSIGLNGSMCIGWVDLVKICSQPLEYLRVDLCFHYPFQYSCY